LTQHQTKSGVLLVGHGTRDAAGTTQFLQLRDELATLLEPTPVQASLLEFQEPTIEQGWNALAGRDVSHVHVAPLLLFAAGHAKQDIPEAIQACQKSTPDMSYDQCRPLSRHRQILKLIIQRLEESFDQITSQPQRTAVLMVGRGSYDPCASTDMQVLTELVKHRTDFASVSTAFYAMANPRLPEVLEQLSSNDQIDAVIVQPHLLFEGRLYQAIAKIVAETAKKYSHIRWMISGYLGPDPLVAQALATRIQQARIARSE